jgi:hypothetical protein
LTLKGLNIIAGGNAPGTTHEIIFDPEGVAYSTSRRDPFRDVWLIVE